jgi:WD40 repeat protein
VQDGILTVYNLSSQLATTATLWDKKTGEILRQQTWNSNSNEAEVSRDGYNLIIAFQSANLTLFDLRKWQPLTTLYGHGYITLRVDFTPDSQHLVSVSVDGTVRLWNLTPGNEIMRLKGFSNIISAVAVNTDGTTAAIQEYSPSEPAQLGLWDLKTGEFLRPLGRFQDSFRGIAFSPDNKTIAATTAWFDPGLSCSASSSTVTLIDVQSGKVLWTVTIEGVIIFGGIAFTGDGSKIIGVAPECGEPLITLNAATGELFDSWKGHEAGINTVSASRDGKWMATGSWDATAILWNAAGQVVYTLQHDAPVVSVVFSPDSHLLLTSSLDNQLHIWDVVTGQEIKQLTGHTASVWSMEFSPNGKYIVSSSQDFNVFVWDWKVGEVVRQFSIEQFGPAGTTVNFNPDGQSIYLQTAENEVFIHEIDLMLEESELMEWTHANRYIPELTCEQRELYRIEPLCETAQSG